VKFDDEEEIKPDDFEQKPKRKKAKTLAVKKVKKEPTEEEPLITLNTIPEKTIPRLRKKVIRRFQNSEYSVNPRFYRQLKNFEPESEHSKRTGLIAKKVGMTGLFDKWGVRHGLTVLQVDRCQVIQIKKAETDGYFSLQLGAGERNHKKLRKPEIGHYLKAGVPAKRVLKEFRVTPENILPIGFQLSSRHFTPGQFVDVSGVSIGKGFQGTVKKFHFKMQPATHGNSLSHRAMGSTGQRQDPGRVFKNKKMPGRMGGIKRTVPNLQVYKIDATRALIYVKGSVPGKPGTFCFVRDAVRKKYINFEHLNFPTFIPQPDQKYASEIIMKPPELDPKI